MEPLSRHPRPGVEQWRNPRNGLVVVRLHYSCDPRKRTPEWKAESSRNMHPRAWQREYEINWAAPAGEPVVPEYQEAKHCQPFEWERRLRLLRFWDFGRVSPVCLFAQLTLFGQLRIRRELCPFNTPLDQLTEGVEAITIELGGRDALLDRKDAWDVGGSTPEGLEVFDAGDPAGKNLTDLGSSAEVLGVKGIILHTTRPGTEVSYANLRARFLRDVMEPGVGPRPAIVVHPECPNLRSALAGAFHLSPLPPYKPTKTHPEGDLVDALRYGEDNIRASFGQPQEGWRKIAGADTRELRAAAFSNEADSWAETQRAKWQQLVEGM